MDPIIECVPNISEGRDRAVIDAVTAVVDAVEGVKVLDVDPGAATNRTVFTFVGAPAAVQEAAFALVKTTQSLVDMRRHEGEHARQGATDVCPLVPVANCTLEDCAVWARELGSRIGDELGIPVYLYGEAASSEKRKGLPFVRAGEYEGLQAKLDGATLVPDFGPTAWNESIAKSGATAVGARPFLIAYNVNLNTRDRKKALDIAFDLRESGRSKRESYPDGKIIRHPDGKPVKIPGKLKAMAGWGWYIEEYGCAQVTVNLTDFRQTSIHAAFDAVCDEAAKRGLRVTGSELVGMVPLEAMLEAGRHYLGRASKTAGVPEAELVYTAVRSLGLNDVAPFKPAERIIEYAIREGADSLVEKTCRGFADELSSDSPAPGGGSVAALAAALGCGLAAMVGALTHGKFDQQEDWDVMQDVGIKAQRLKDFFLAAVDRDTDSFNRVMDAMRIKAATDEDKTKKQEAVQAATKGATEVPFQVLEKTLEALALAETATRHGNPNALSDAGVAAAMLRSGAQGAAMNVMINLADIKDAAYVEEKMARARTILDEVRKTADRVVDGVMEKLASAGD